MNDPGLSDPIQDSAQNADKEHEKSSENDALDDDQAYLEPSRWWFASTAFPLLAGTFGPMASAFNICALVENWREAIAPGGDQETGTDIADPKWLISVNAISLVFALVANLALLFNMAKRLSFSVAQPITIIGWYVAGFILVVLACVASYGLELPEGQVRALTQAYYYAIMAAGIYIAVAILMSITVFGAVTDHYEKEFQLTISQRTLMLQTITYFVFLLIGALVFSKIEGWRFLDAVYWGVTTTLTIGTGDFSPATHLGRSLLFPFAVVGILILGLVIGSIRSLVLERGKKKLGARMIEKQREKVVEQIHKNDGKIKMTLLSETKDVTGEGKSERERREQEFTIMREVQEQASSRRKWTSLGISAIAWLTLWLLGAVVFWRFDYDAQPEVTYFNWIYFAFVSLTTIGYGDFAPGTNGAKAFFVFWALLAIPTLTILISNMGDTIIKGIRNITLRFGEITVLPEKGSPKSRLKEVAHTMTKDKFRGVDLSEESPGGVFMSTGNRDPEKGENEGQSAGAGGTGIDAAAREVEEQELDDADLARQRGDTLSEDIHLYHYLLVKEIRNVMKDLNGSPPKEYTYEEWCWFLRLMGEDESNTRHHRKAPLNVQDSQREEGPQIQTAIAIGDDEDMADDNHKQWSWLGAKSPLMGQMEEAEWVLERLSVTLETQLRKERENLRRKGGAGEKGEGTEGTKGNKTEKDGLPLSEMKRHVSGDSSRTLGKESSEDKADERDGKEKAGRGEKY